MKKLTPVEEVYETTLTKEDNVSIPNLLTQDRDLAYTSLIEGIDSISKKEANQHGEPMLATDFFMNTGYNQALTDIIEKVVKPLYGKE